MRVLVPLVSVFLLLFAAITLMKGRQSEEAVHAESVSPDSANRDAVREFWAAYRTATQHRVAGSLEQALVEYERSLELNPDHEDALYYAGSVHFDLGQFREAERAWHHLAEVNPGASRAHLRLGDIYFCFEQENLFDPVSAQREFERAFDINSQETGPLLRLGEVALYQGDWERAGDYFDAVAAANFRSVAAHFYEGYLAWRSGDVSEAERRFRLAIQNYQPDAPIQGVAAEGDTRSGKAILAESSQCRSLQAFSEDLPSSDDPDLMSHMQRRYGELSAFLERTRQGG